MRLHFPVLAAETWTVIKKRHDVFLTGVLLFALIDTFMFCLLQSHVRDAALLLHASPVDTLSDAQMHALAVKLATVIGVIFCLVIILFIGTMYFFLVGVLKDGHAGRSIGKRLIKSAGPLLSIYLWALVCSMMWIPYIGWIPGVILGPRFLLAPVVYLEEKKNLWKSVARSYALTGSEWLTILWQIILAGLPVLISLSIFLLLLPSILLVSAWISFVPFLLLWLSTAAFCLFVCRIYSVLKR